MTARGAIIAIAIIPSLYAWFYLRSARDPYGNTADIKVAIASNDLGWFLSGNYLNLGREVEAELRENTDLGRRFVDESVAREGVERWHYSSAIIFSTGFTQDTISFLDNVATHPDIDYIVNQKSNSIAAKISFQGINTIVQNIQEKFLKTLNTTIFEAMNRAGERIDDNQSLLDENNQLLNSSNNLIQSSSLDLTSIQQQLNDLSSLIIQSKDNLPKLEQQLSDRQDILEDLSEFWSGTHTHLSWQLAIIQNTLPELQHLLQHNSDLAQALISSSWTPSQDLLREIASNISSLQEKTESLLAGVATINGFFERIVGRRPLDWSQDRLHALQSQLQNYHNRFEGGAENIDTSKETLREITNSLQNINVNTTETLKNLENRIDKDLSPFFDTLQEIVQDRQSDTIELLQTLKEKLPSLDDQLHHRIDSLASLQHNISTIQQSLPDIKSRIQAITTEVNRIHNGDMLDKLKTLLSYDPESHGSFAADMVRVNTTDLFDIPNYESGMAPFFVALAL